MTILTQSLSHTGSLTSEGNVESEGLLGGIETTLEGELIF
jgi:hypothetical protein